MKKLSYEIYLLIILKDWAAEREGGLRARERDAPSIVSLPIWLKPLASHWSEARATSGYPTWVQGPKDLSHHQLISEAQHQGAGLEAEVRTQISTYKGSVSDTGSKFSSFTGQYPRDALHRYITLNYEKRLHTLLSSHSNNWYNMLISIFHNQD